MKKTKTKTAGSGVLDSWGIVTPKHPDPSHAAYLHAYLHAANSVEFETTEELLEDRALRGLNDLIEAASTIKRQIEYRRKLMKSLAMLNEAERDEILKSAEDSAAYFLWESNNEP